MLFEQQPDDVQQVEAPGRHRGQPVAEPHKELGQPLSAVRVEKPVLLGGKAFA